MFWVKMYQNSVKMIKKRNFCFALFVLCFALLGHRKYNLKPTGAQLKSVTVPRFKIFLNNSYIILLFVNFTTLPYFACTGEHLVKILLKSD